jgi:Ca2+-binding RTX toxin-like protein
MSNAFIDAGFGNVLAYISGHTNVLPAINNTVKIEGTEGALKAGVSATQTAASVWEMIGKQLPVIQVAGKTIPITTLILSGAGLQLDYNSIRQTYKDTGTINTADIYSALGNLTSAASALALGAAVLGTATTAPVWLSAAAALTVAGAVLAVASVAADSSFNPDALLNDIRNALSPVSQSLGEAWDSAMDALNHTLDSASDAFQALSDYLSDMMEKALEGISNLLEAAREAAADAAAATGIPVEALKKLMAAAANAISPLILDLDGDGVETSDRPVWFDHDGNGYAQRTGWVGKDDGLLVLDKNGNGAIDNGGELFGNNTQLASGEMADNGFLALADYDSNGDGIIDANDRIFSQLRIWQDRNGNGVTDDGELLTLEQAGISAIEVDWKNIDYIDSAGNHHKQQGSFTRTDGTTGDITDVWFTQDTAYRIDKNRIEVSEEIARLPEIIGSGVVGDLQQAMARGDDTLKSLVQQFIQHQDRGQRLELVDQILRQWSGAVSYDSASRGSNIDAQKLYTLEAFLDFHFEQSIFNGDNLGMQAAKIIESAWELLVDNIYGQLMLQSHLADIIELAEWRQENSQIVWHYDTMIATLQARYIQDPLATQETLLELHDVLNKVNNPFTQQIQNALANYSSQEESDFSSLMSLFRFDSHYEFYTGSAQADSLSTANTRPSFMLGLSGDDTLTGSNKDDILSGGRGNDTLVGGSGNDTYLYASGDGHDSIREEYNGGTSDRLRLENISADRISVSRSGDDMLLSIRESHAGAGDSGSVLLTGQVRYANDSTGIEFVEFDDGTLWNKQTLRDILFAAARTDGDDTITGSDGADILSGGRGNDTLVGASGNDTYLYASGDGHDSIREEYNGGTSDRLRLENISADRISVSRSGDDMLLSIRESHAGAGDGGSVLLTGQARYANGSSGVEFVEFDDGTLWNKQTLRDILFAAARTDGDDTITGSDGADILSGGRGNDTLVGGSGNDTYLYASGDGHDSIREEYNGGTSDRLRLENISADRISVSRSGDDMLLSIRESHAGAGDGGSVLLTGQVRYANSSSGVEFVEFDDGTLWNKQTLRDILFAAAHTDGDDTITGSDGTDILSGGRGNDTLVGGSGNDTYLYASGDGHDSIREEYNGGTSDRLRLENISADRISVSRSGDDMLLSIRESHAGAGDNGSVLLTGQVRYANDSTGIEFVDFDDGTIWNKQHLQEMLQTWQVFSNPMEEDTATLDPTLFSSSSLTHQEALWA